MHNESQPSNDSKDQEESGFAGNWHIVTWKTAMTGGACSAEEVLASLAALSVDVGAAARRMTQYICLAGLGDERETRFVQKTVSECGFKEETTLRAIVGSATRQGLRLCPQDAALALRQEYSSMSRDERFIFVSEPVMIAGLPHLFTLERRKARILLSASELSQGSLLKPDERLVLARSEAFSRDE